MARTTIGNIISRVRTQVKGVKQDPLLTDRVIYSFILKHAKWLMKREDGKNNLLIFSTIAQTLDFVELVEIDKVEASCTGLSSDCTIKRTKEKMPMLMQGYTGPLIRAISSLDGSVEVNPTIPSTYLVLSKSKNFKYNKTKYYWYLNDYIYFPNIEWDAVRIEGIFEDDTAPFVCADKTECRLKSDLPFNVPDYMHAELESNVFKDLASMMQIPADMSNDKQNVAR
jgi:hypothetical protein